MLNNNIYIDYNYKIRIICWCLFIKKKRFIINKYLTVYKLNKLIDYYNDMVVNKRRDIIVGNYKLDKEQLRAIYTDEVVTLVLAGAGSGKTSLIIGKINYLIERCGIKEEEILCLSFTNEAVNNLKARLEYNICVLTFHKLALKILGNKYKINNNYLSYVIDEYFLGIAINNNRIKKKLVNLIDKVNVNKYNYYLENGYFDYLKDTIKRFIELFIVSGKDIRDFLYIKKYKNIILIIIDVYCLYISELESKYEIDLNLLITKASNSNNCTNNYKYIIVDEFQDISSVRLKLLESLIIKGDSKLLVVGDDYQSIYAFSGSNLQSYLNLIKNKYTKVIKLKTCYRCCKEIVNISSNFIMKNRKQIKKRIICNKSISKAIVIANDLVKLMDYLSSRYSSVLILGRNNKDINHYINDLNKYENIEYKTVHSAKGLESDCIVIINLEDKVDGFPSKIRNPDVIDYVFPKEDYLYAEERRLFYVALTRSKNEVYLINSNNPSIFLKEIIKDNKKNITYLNL